ncbi:MAG TPA: purine-nucleoside phosphorylase, partial [Thermodesulfobacteriaceae bacterium]|nr:purine-nucleoside phosphorylase [Thermodesulfobacteriaceae bacterium]
MAKDYFERVETARSFLEGRLPFIPEILLILGTGLSGVGEKVVPEVVIPYREIPHFPVSTVESHAGELVVGHLAGKSVAAFRGRFHYYEGYS